MENARERDKRWNGGSESASREMRGTEKSRQRMKEREKVSPTKR